MRQSLPWISSALLLIALIAYVLESRARAQRRLENFSTAVNRYDQYARAYAAFAEKKPFIVESCYGNRWDRYSDEILKDLQVRSGDVDYLMNRADHFATLKVKYETAVAHPEATISLDPPLGP